MTLQEQFIRERIYLKSVSPATVTWYEQAFKRFEGALDSKAAILDRIIQLKDRGLSVVSINSHLRVVNAFLNWCHKEGHRPDRIKIPKLKEEQTILATLTEDLVRIFLNFKPRGVNATRAWRTGVTILDTGVRLSEALGVRKEDIDMENLTMRVKGKGGKHRQVPFSSELRRLLFRFVSKLNEGSYLFGTRNRTALTTRNFQRDFKELGQQMGVSGVRWSAHTLRHSFSVIYLRKGGNLEYLRRILGHTSILTTQRYLKSLGVTDLQKVHDDLSPLRKK